MSDDKLWYRDAVIYQIHVRAFADSNADGIGDFRGLTSKLDYLQDLGVTALWLLPFYPSPLRDDGYDIADYTAVNDIYGTMADFKQFLREAHRRELRVITELVINHTSDQHAWFQRSRHAKPGSRWRDFYVWSDTPERYADARIIFKDFETSNWTWDPVARAYYWHRFYSHQPDLNFEHPPVRRAVIDLLDAWFKLGVDGLRLDAVPYLYEREGTSCENLPETHAFLKELRRHVDGRFEDRMLLAEANQWPEDAVAYFGDGDEAHMAFHFPVMPRLYMALHMEDRFPVVDILQQTPTIPETAQWALFLRNHDELTLEMVTDEDRDYMYRVYAGDPRMRINLGIRRRLAPLMGNDRRRIELLNALLLSLPGTPIVYYGDEIGMGDNIYLGDRNGVRTPMHWSADRNAGFSRANPQRLYSPVIIDPEYHFEAINVEAQQGNTYSLLWWMKRMIGLRKRFASFGRGSIEFLHPDNRKVLTFLRQHEDEIVLVIANLSRVAQAVELDLSEYRDFVPVEAIGQTPFPPIGELPYFLTLAPHAFYWFALEPPRAEVLLEHGDRDVPLVRAVEDWSRALADARIMDRVLRAYLPTCRWFGAKSRTLKGAAIADRIPVAYDGCEALLLLIDCTYEHGDPETYVLPLVFLTGEAAEGVRYASPQSVVARLEVDGDGGTTEGLLTDALSDSRFSSSLLHFLTGRKRLRGTVGALHPVRTRAFRDLHGTVDASVVPSPLRAEQSNTSVAFGDDLILKVFRKLEIGVNPDFEVGRFLTEGTGFDALPRVAGALEYRATGSEPRTVGLLQEYAVNEGDAWTYTVDGLAQYLDEVLALPVREDPPPAPAAHPLDVETVAPPDVLAELLGPFFERVDLLAARTAELHTALGSRHDDPTFAPENSSAQHQRSRYQAGRTRARNTLDLLRRRLRDLPAEARPVARAVLERENRVYAVLRAVVGRKLGGRLIRCHGDYHLGQVLYTGRDFVIIDFEGEPARPLSERRFKRTALVDVAGMLRSFDYAVEYALRSGRVRPEDSGILAPWAELWRRWTATRFLTRYIDGARASGLLPTAPSALRALLDFCLLDKALYELVYELNHRPDWVGIPLDGVHRLLAEGGEDT